MIDDEKKSEAISTCSKDFETMAKKDFKDFFNHFEKFESEELATLETLSKIINDTKELANKFKDTKYGIQIFFGFWSHQLKTTQNAK